MVDSFELAGAYVTACAGCGSSLVTGDGKFQTHPLTVGDDRRAIAVVLVFMCAECEQRDGWPDRVRQLMEAYGAP